MSNTVTALQQKISAQREELAKLEQQLQTLESESVDKQLARELHKVVCTHNHTDGCGWFYEPEKGERAWTGNEHQEYLGRAQKLLHFCSKLKITTGQAINIYRLIKGYSFATEQAINTYRLVKEYSHD